MKLIDIAFDFDGVLCDFHPALDRVLWKNHKAKIVYPITKWDIDIDPPMADEQLWECFIEAFENMDLKYTPILPGAKELLRKLYDMSDNDPVKIITARPPKRAANDTYRYISENLCDYPYELVLTSDHDKLPYINRYSFFVEDKLTTAEHLAANGKIVFLVNRGHNMNKELPDRIHRIKDLRTLIPLAHMFVKEV